jgi:hypothetical protein
MVSMLSFDSLIISFEKTLLACSKPGIGLYQFNCINVVTINQVEMLMISKCSIFQCQRNMGSQAIVILGRFKAKVLLLKT